MCSVCSQVAICGSCTVEEAENDKELMSLFVSPEVMGQLDIEICSDRNYCLCSKCRYKKKAEIPKLNEKEALKQLEKWDYQHIPIIKDKMYNG